MKPNVIGVSARIGGGKDVFASMIQYFESDFSEKSFENWSNFRVQEAVAINSKWKVKKFAGKLKQVASLLTGIPVEKFEEQNVKNDFIENHISKDQSCAWDYCVDFPEAHVGCRKYNEANLEWTRMKIRTFLQKLGTDAVRKGLHVNTWLNALWVDYSPEQNWIITDMRFDNEYQSVKSHGGITVRLTRNSNIKSSHPSEISLDNHKFDYVIDNQGKSLKDTYLLVEKFWEEVLK